MIITRCISRALGMYPRDITDDMLIPDELTRLELAVFLESEFGVSVDETKFTTVREVWNELHRRGIATVRQR